MWNHSLKEAPSTPADLKCAPFPSLFPPPLLHWALGMLLHLTNTVAHILVRFFPFRGHEVLMRLTNIVTEPVWTNPGRMGPDNGKPCLGDRTGRPFSCHLHGSASLAPYDGWADDETCLGERKTKRLGLPWFEIHTYTAKSFNPSCMCDHHMHQPKPCLVACCGRYLNPGENLALGPA